MGRPVKPHSWRFGISKPLIWLMSLLPASFEAALLSEKEVLGHLYNSLDGGKWDIDWDIDDADYCSYYGVICDTSSHILEVNLPNNNLIGTITPHLYTLPYLRQVDFSKNSIVNGGWEKIDDILENDELVGPIEVIDLTSNKVNSIKGIEQLAGYLKGLHMTFNNLQGTMPDELFELKDLKVLAISENNIIGPLDPRIGLLTNLIEFYCYGNQVTGHIPAEIGLLNKIQILTLAENQLSGPLPQEINEMVNLKTFSVHNNEPNTGSHSGPLPRFDKHPYLNQIYLDGNAFTGSIPHLFLHLFNSTGQQVTIGLSNNQITGTVPVQFLKFRSLNLDIVGNNITGFDERICDSDTINAWMNGLVEQFGCDAVLCPNGTYLETGRQEDADTPCEVCDEGTAGLLGATQCGSDQNQLEELEILADFYLGTGGRQWNDVDGWDVMYNIESAADLTLPSFTGVNHCTFAGVTCENGKVVMLTLPSNGLEGMVPPSLFDLPALRSLDLSGNEIHLDRDFGFGDVGNAQSLEKLDLSSNDIQTFAGIGAAKVLKELYIDDAYFFSTLDTEVYELDNLRILHVQYSGLKGELPPGISKMTNLRAINFYGNEFTGKIPDEIGSLTKLWHLDFSENDFDGDLPTAAIKKLPDLQKFHVHQSGRVGTGITGKLPSFAEQTKIHMISVSSNSMTGDIPDDFLAGVDDTDLEMQIDLGYNYFTGKIPGHLAKFSNMTLKAVRNNFDSVDTALCSLRGWMAGEVGDIIDAGGDGCDAILCPKGTYNEYGQAKSGSKGVCQPCFTAEYAGSTTCNGDSEKLERKILNRLYVETVGSNWTSSANWTTGALCSYEGVICESGDSTLNEGVVELDLSGFGLIGDIPTAIYELPYLKKVDFSNNVVGLSFEGIDLATQLESIIMSDADLTSLSGIENAPKTLKKLHIERNSFDGDIPAELFSVESLVSLSIGFNGFTGKISPAILGLKSIEEFWAGGNNIIGPIPKEISQLPKLRSLVLSGNKMSGHIPKELNNIPTLMTLHLNGQHDFGGFSGPIPSLDNAPVLHDINLSRNSLVGSIPDNFLATVRASESHDVYAGVSIDLSHNQITGEIPANFDDFVGLFLNAAGNMITGVPTEICDDDDEFMNGLVGKLPLVQKCDAILCPKGTFSPIGRQTEVDVPCEPCPGESEELRLDQAPFFGSTKCDVASAEKVILKKIYNLIFTESSESKYWMSDNPICTWYGITCSGQKSADDGVEEINLESNSLQADDTEEVSELFFDLPSLRVLNLRGNKVPLKFDKIGNAKSLEVLQLSATGLESLDGISHATKLTELHFTENKVGGPFPEELLDLPNIEKLYISFNKISGPLPGKIGDLNKLKEFFAYTNDLTGTIPTELGKLINLENLVLGQNKFRGSIPTELNNLVSMKELSFYYQESTEGLSGKILNFSKMTHLASLDLEGNKFTGPIPINFLSGLDSDFVSSGEPIVLHLADNMFTGTLPEGLKKIKNLYIDIVGNHFKGPIPESFCQKTLWMDGKVGQLETCDAIACPKNTFSVSGRQNSDSSDQKCTPCGNSETAPFLGSTSCRKEDVEKAALVALYDATNGDAWTKNDGWKDNSKPICSWQGVTCSGGNQDTSSVTELNLDGNNMAGTMPSGIFEMPFLKVLDMRDNRIFMKFDNIDKAKKLEVLYISSIDIGDVSGIGKAPSLREIHLTANDLSGRFPEEIFDLAGSLQQLYIAYNSFSGTLSKRFGELSKLTDFYAYDNAFTGGIPSEFGLLEKLQNLVLAENHLSGVIPEELGALPSLRLFSAYRRLKPGPKLSGHLPSFSKVPQLQGLYLDYNHLTGPIPKDFLASSLHTELITLSNNLLTGPVPIELDSFDQLNIEMEGNKISDLDAKFCDNLLWMNKAVQYYDCDGILCPPHTYSVYGRQNSSDSSCLKCDPGSESTPYWGSTGCDVPLDEREILELLYNRCGGPSWHNKDNWLTSKSVCDWYGIECRNGTSVQAIRLGSNNLIGTPPEEIFLLRQLHILWLHSNPIDFKFKGIEKAVNLLELRLDSTGLSDIYGLGNAKTLMKLDLKFNRISGTFPTELLKLDKLESLSLTDNSMVGSLPESFGSLENLISLRLGSNEFSGPLRSFENLSYLLHVDLSDNKFTGYIPNDFLASISTRKPVEIDLSSNRLSGAVPIELDRFSNLVIYLRDNKFNKLPLSLCDRDNRGWNLRDVELYGCDAIMCPPGTYNFLGRQSSETSPCEKCLSNVGHYGQVTCSDHLVSSSSHFKPWFQDIKLKIMALLFVGVFVTSM